MSATFAGTPNNQSTNQTFGAPVMFSKAVEHEGTGVTTLFSKPPSGLFSTNWAGPIPWHTSNQDFGRPVESQAESIVLVKLTCYSVTGMKKETSAIDTCEDADELEAQLMAKRQLINEHLAREVVSAAKKEFEKQAKTDVSFVVKFSSDCFFQIAGFKDAVEKACVPEGKNKKMVIEIINRGDSSIQCDAKIIDKTI